MDITITAVTQKRYRVEELSEGELFCFVEPNGQPYPYLHMRIANRYVCLNTGATYSLGGPDLKSVIKMTTDPIIARPLS